MGDARTTPVVLGVDVGSTTVKAVALDPETREVLWSDYQRHLTKQPEKVLELLTAIEAAFPNSPRAEWRIFLTGSGAMPLCAGLGGKFVQEVNAVVAAEGGRRIWVGSSSGLSLFDNGTRVRTLGEKSGLASQNVAGISLDPTAGEGVVTLATSEGVSQVDGPVTRSVTAFHGLPSNHTYAVAAVAGKTYVGTLGGLAQLNGLRIERVYSTANSRLPHNWVNAIVAASGRVYVGTYGGGVAVVLPGGDIQPEEPTKGLEVNPGAMALVGSRLFVGTLRSGVWMLDIDSHRWTKVESVLSSDNVTAIAANDRYVFLGTENGITRIELRRLGMGNSQ